MTDIKTSSLINISAKRPRYCIRHPARHVLPLDLPQSKRPAKRPLFDLTDDLTDPDVQILSIKINTNHKRLRTGDSVEQDQTLSSILKSKVSCIGFKWFTNFQRVMLQARTRRRVLPMWDSLPNLITTDTKHTIASLVDHHLVLLLSAHQVYSHWIQIKSLDFKSTDTKQQDEGDELEQATWKVVHWLLNLTPSTNPKTTDIQIKALKILLDMYIQEWQVDEILIQMPAWDDAWFDLSHSGQQARYWKSERLRQLQTYPNRWTFAQKQVVSLVNSPLSFQPHFIESKQGNVQSMIPLSYLSANAVNKVLVDAKCTKETHQPIERFSKMCHKQNALYFIRNTEPWKSKWRFEPEQEASFMAATVNYIYEQ